MKLSDLTPNPANPRRITEEELKSLEASMDEFGDISGIWFNVRFRRMGGGHQRAKIIPPDSEIEMIERFMEPTARGTVGYGFVTHDGEKYFVRLVDWPEEKERAANLRANKEGEGRWEPKLLADWLIELDTGEVDMSLTGFSEKEIEDICAPYRTIPEEEPPTDSAPKEVTCPKCGEVFLTGQEVT